jgi:GTP 3',8-cyclase
VKSLIDTYGREIKKLRVSLTDQCNLRCLYCMPVNSSFMDDRNFLSPDELVSIVTELQERGLVEVRLTGGEPLVRRNFREIIQRLSLLNLKKLSLTTNGILLDEYFDDLKASRIFSLNISLDSLRPETFKKISYRDHFSRVMRNIEKAKELGFLIKINMVLMKGINDHEVKDFVEFSEKLQVEVRFLELMRIGVACSSQKDQFISAREVIHHLQKQYTLTPVHKDKDSTSYNFLTNTKAHIGFIASESEPFCGHCSRWRLSADGKLKACLLKEDARSLKNTTSVDRETLYQELLGLKPMRRPFEVAHQMNEIGG